jgi:hypothetical protein
MSDKEIKLLEEYVKNGGNLVATYCSSLFDDTGKERNDFGLANLFGVSYAGERENTRRDNYQYILNRHHPLVEPDSEQTELLFNAGFTALTKPAQDANVICTWVPTIQNQPPDKSWVAKFSTEFPTVVENKTGKGKVFYFANQPDLLSYKIGHQDPRNLLLRSIRNLAGDAIPIETNAPASVNIGLTKSLMGAGEYVLSLVNLTSGPVRPIRSVLPVYDIHVRLTLDGKSIKAYRVLRSQGDCSITKNGNTLNIQLNKLQDFCAIHIEMVV